MEVAQRILAFANWLLEEGISKFQKGPQCGLENECISERETEINPKPEASIDNGRQINLSYCFLRSKAGFSCFKRKPSASSAVTFQESPQQRRMSLVENWDAENRQIQVEPVLEEAWLYHNVLSTSECQYPATYYQIENNFYEFLNNVVGRLSKRAINVDGRK